MFYKDNVLSSVQTLNWLVGEWVWIDNVDRKWAKVVGYAYDQSNGFRFLWEQYDVGPDVTELWDDGEFTINDIGNTVFIGDAADEACKKFEQELEKQYHNSND